MIKSKVKRERTSNTLIGTGALIFCIGGCSLDSVGDVYLYSVSACIIGLALIKIGAMMGGNRDEDC